VINATKQQVVIVVIMNRKEDYYEKKDKCSMFGSVCFYRAYFLCRAGGDRCGGEAAVSVEWIGGYFV
jgi:hypothetical protein